MQTHVIQVDGYDCYIGLAGDDFMQNMVSVQVKKGPYRIGETKVSANDDLEQLHRQVVLKVRSIVLAGVENKALSQINTQPFSFEVAPEMVEHDLKLMDSSKVKGCMEEWVHKEWFEYAAVAKKILDQRKQP